MHGQLVKDVSADPGGGSGCESHCGDPGKLVSEFTEFLVVWSEVVPPLTDAVSLVYHKPGPQDMRICTL